MARWFSSTLVFGCFGFVLRTMQWLAYDSQTELFTGNSLFLPGLFVKTRAIFDIDALYHTRYDKPCTDTIIL